MAQAEITKEHAVSQLSKASSVQAPPPAESLSIEHIRPFRASQINIDPTSARIEGKVPEWLQGELVRTCPGIFKLPHWTAEHWFDALGLVFGFKFSDQGVSLRCRQLASKAAEFAAAGTMPYASFDTKIQRSNLKRIFEPATRPTDNANVNIVRFGDKWVALTETPYPMIIDQKDLGTKGEFTFNDRFPERCIMSAHPQYDFARQKIVNALVFIGAFSYIAFYEHDSGSHKREEIARMYFQRLPYIHSFGMTPHHLVLVSHPFRAVPARFLWSNRGFIEAFSWTPEEGTEIYVFDRRSKKWTSYQTDAFFAFHVAHCYEQNNELVLDLIAHPNPHFIFDYRTEALRRQLPTLRGSLQRLRLQSSTKKVQREVLSPLGFEFPSVSYKRVQGKPARWVWGAGGGLEGKSYRSALIATDVTTGKTETYEEPDMVFGEPVFVGRPGTRGEDEGLIIAVGTHLHKDLSVCVLLDASTFKPLARALVDFALPLGFHGSFFPDASHS